MLFSDLQRSAHGPRLYAEPSYDYLERSARPEAAKIRILLEQWYSAYPDKEKAELKARIQSRDESLFGSATFELFLFALCRSIGFHVVVHPKLPSGKATPDFLLSDSRGKDLYLEAVLASDVSHKARAAGKRKNALLDSINKLESPNFYLGINSRGDPASPPNGRRLKADLEKWLSTLDPDEVIQDLDVSGHEVLPKFEWSHQGWEIQFEAIPKSPERRNTPSRVIGFIAPEGRYLSTWTSMRGAVISKGRKYGKLDKPLLIAVGVQSWHVHRIDEMQALIGQEEFVFNSHNLTKKPVIRRRPNGAWVGPRGARYTRISGVWFFHGFDPWTIAKQKANMYLNPWAEQQLPKTILVFNYFKAEKHTMRLHEGTSVREVLGLDTTWPT